MRLLEAFTPNEVSQMTFVGPDPTEPFPNVYLPRPRLGRSWSVERINFFPRLVNAFNNTPPLTPDTSTTIVLKYQIFLNDVFVSDPIEQTYQFLVNDPPVFIDVPADPVSIQPIVPLTCYDTDNLSIKIISTQVGLDFPDAIVMRYSFRAELVGTNDRVEATA